MQAMVLLLLDDYLMTESCSLETTKNEQGTLFTFKSSNLESAISFSIQLSGQIPEKLSKPKPSQNGLANYSNPVKKKGIFQKSSISHRVPKIFLPNVK